MTKCPLYGCQFLSLGGRLILVSSGGNQCPLLFRSFSPCAVEMAGGEPDLEICGYLEPVGLAPASAGAPRLEPAKATQAGQRSARPSRT